MPSVVRPPGRFRKLIARVMELDRAYFERHPTERHYRRAYVPGEFYPRHYPTVSHVSVIAVAPGLRARQPLFQD